MHRPSGGHARCDVCSNNPPSFNTTPTCQKSGMIEQPATPSQIHVILEPGPLSANGIKKGGHTTLKQLTYKAFPGGPPSTFTPTSCFTWSCIKLGWASQGADVRSRRSARLVSMFNATLIVIEAFIRELRTMYERTYSTLEPDYPGVISFAAQ